MDNSESRLALLARIASLYYDKNKTQQEIAEITGMTRTGVSRLITEARERSVVDIIVHYPWNSQRMEEALMTSFGLKAARVMVLDHESYDDTLVGLGVLAAAYFNQFLQSGMTIGISWGSALNQMIKALRPPRLTDLEVVQLIGATGSENILTDGPLLAQILSRCLESNCRYLHAPLVVESPITRDALLQERTIRETLARASEADVALVGIGSIDPDLYSLKRAGYLSEAERQQLADAGVVGDICGRHYSIDGTCMDLEINNRVVGIDLTALKKIKTVIAVAGDVRKGEAILGALRGKYIDVLVTDDKTASYLLANA